MLSAVMFWLSIPVVAAALVSPIVWWRRRRRGGLLRGVVLTTLMAPLPWLWFLAGALMVPECKDVGATWVDMFPQGKLLLLPLVLWATAALFVVEIEEAPVARWMVRGLVTGAVVSGVCLVQGVVDLVPELGGDPPLLVGVVLSVPLYVFVWHTARAVQLIRESGFGGRDVAMSVGIGAPLWAAAIADSAMLWEQLPDQCAECFVVTAATGGHRSIVGGLATVERGGRPRLANRQLVTFWRFEDAWRARSPRSHRAFRRVYGRVGPIVAARVNTRWRADAMHVVLRPAELAAASLTWALEARRAPSGAGPA